MSNEKDPIRVIFISKISKEVRNYLSDNLSECRNLELIYPNDFSEQYILDLVPKADILIGWRPNKEILEKAIKLRVFINPGAGVKHLIDMFRDISSKRSIKLINGHGNSYFVAQHAVALLLSLASKIIPHHQWMKEGKWRTGDDDAETVPLRFRNIGLLGYGAINQKVHKMLSGFNVEFSILKRSWENFRGSKFYFTKYSRSQLKEFLTKIDTLIIAVPHTSKTESMISTEQLRLLSEGKEKALIVNVARGEIVEERALYEALKDETIHGAAIDVWYDNKPEADENGRKYPYACPFHELDNVILSPHRGYSPFRDLLRWNEVIENLKKISRGEDYLINQVDLGAEY